MALRRPVIGVFKILARTVGALLIVVAILGLPEMRFLTKGLEGGFRLLSSLALLFAAAVWLIAAELLFRFFDHYMSRN